MADIPTTRRQARKAERPKSTPLPLLPVCDTVSGRKAASDPAAAIRHYEKLADQLWLPPRVQQLADGILAELRVGRTCWASVSGPYGYGKTAAGVVAWRYAREQGFTTIPPLSCSSFDELAQGVAAMSSALHPEARTRIDRIFRRVWERGLDEAVQADARRFELPTRKVRRMLQEKLQAGQISLDGQCHRLVEFLSELGRLAKSWSHGLVVVLDELQQLLGPLDCAVGDPVSRVRLGPTDGTVSVRSSRLPRRDAGSTSRPLGGGSTPPYPRERPHTAAGRGLHQRLPELAVGPSYDRQRHARPCGPPVPFPGRAGFPGPVCREARPGQRAADRRGRLLPGDVPLPRHEKPLQCRRLGS